MATRAAQRRSAGAAFERTARKVRESPAADAIARVGLVSRAVVYFCVALLAAMLAGGHRPERADSKGAVAGLAHQPAGRLLVLVATLGFASYALWRAAEGLFGQAKDDKAAPQAFAVRLANLGRAALYASLAAFALPFVFDGRRQAPSGEKESDWTATVLGWPGGRPAVIVVGLGIAAAGLYQAWRGVSGKFEHKLDLDSVSTRMCRAVRVVAVVGMVGRAIVYVQIGLFLAKAALRFDADQAVGVDGALVRMASRPHGPWMLAVTALGLGAFGVYCLAEARWRTVLDDNE